MSISLSDCKRRAAYAAAKRLHLEDGMAIGVGSGSTVVFAVEALNKRCAEEGERENSSCLAVSIQVHLRIADYGVTTAGE